MHNLRRFIKALSIFPLGLMVVVMLTACAKPAAQSTPETRVSGDGSLTAGAIEPLHPQPSRDGIAPGLAVRYFRSFKARHLDHLPKGDFALEVSREGLPIPFLNHVFGKGKVFDSGEKTLIGMRMQGLLRFPRSGRFQFRAFVNDGIRLYIDRRLVLDDPKWDKAGDRFTRTAGIEAVQDVWYPVTIEYFQRKGTATLQLFWQLPQSDSFVIIPAEAYAHLSANR